MLKLTVSQDGSGDFASISEAVLAVPYELEAEICIGPGIYREKLVCEKRALTLRGAGADATTLIFGDGGKLPHPDGRPTHTFRSYTAFFSGGSVTVEDLTIANDAGPGSAVGQAIAAYVDAEKAVFRRVRLLGNQDTLFCAPLPEAEREKDGFLGPRKFAPRRPSAQYYQSCEIAGDIDFIFGGADALFEQCILRTVDNHLSHSYITAPSGSANGLGFVFWDCDFVSDCPAGTVYLGRPWRPTGKTTVHRRAFPVGMTARTPALPALPRPEAAARGHASARTGSQRPLPPMPPPCWPGRGSSAAPEIKNKGIRI